MADPSVEQVLARLDRMKSARANFESHWAEIRKVIYPAGESFISTVTAGVKTRQDVFDGTPEQALLVFAATLQAMLTNPQTKWFSLRATEAGLDDDEQVALWLEDATDRMMAVFNSPQSGFAANTHEFYLDLGAYGTSNMFVADRPGRLPLFQSNPLNEIFIAENHEGVVDTTYLLRSFTARQAVLKWRAAAGEKVVKAANDAKKADDPFVFLHCVAPRAARDPAALNAENLPFTDTWINVDAKTQITSGGFAENPYVNARWLTLSGEIFGRGPGMSALADAKMLQQVMKVTIRGLEKIVDPPMQMPDDGIVSPAINYRPAANNFVRAELFAMRGDPIRPIQTGGRPDIGEDFMNGVRARIQDAFLRPITQIARDPRMTATQVLALEEEALRLVSPILGRLEAEFLSPLVDRTFGIMLRAGMFAPPPAALENSELRIEFVSPVAKAQQLSEARAVGSTLDVMAGFAQSDPALLDNQDTDQTYRHVARLLGQPASLLRPERDVADMRRARQDATEQMASIQDASELAKAAGAATPAIQALTDAAANDTGAETGAEAVNG